MKKPSRSVWQPGQTNFELLHPNGAPYEYPSYPPSRKPPKTTARERCANEYVRRRWRRNNNTPSVREQVLTCEFDPDTGETWEEFKAKLAVYDRCIESGGKK